MKLDICRLSRKFVWLKYCKNIEYFKWRIICAYDNIQWNLRMRNVSDKICRENQNTGLFSITFFINRAVYEIMWINTQNALLGFYFGNDYANALHYYAIQTLPVWIRLDVVWVVSCGLPAPHPFIFRLLSWMDLRAKLDVLAERYISCFCRVWCKNFPDFARKLVS
jgi:hypothetical protein